MLTESLERIAFTCIDILLKLELILDTSLKDPFYVFFDITASGGFRSLVFLSHIEPDSTFTLES